MRSPKINYFMYRLIKMERICCCNIIARPVFGPNMFAILQINRKYYLSIHLSTYSNLETDFASLKIRIFGGSKLITLQIVIIYRTVTNTQRYLSFLNLEPHQREFTEGFEGLIRYLRQPAPLGCLFVIYHLSVKNGIKRIHADYRTVIRTFGTPP